MMKGVLKKVRFHMLSDEKRIDYYRKQGVKIGKGCAICYDVMFGSEPYLISIGDNVRVGNGVKFFTHDGGLWTLRKMGKLEDADSFGMIKVGNNVTIGWDTTIMPNVTIGSNCVIGCGTVITRDIPDNSVAVGVPAKIVKSIDEYYEKHKDTCDLTKHMSAEEKKKYLVEKFGL